jgi:hypothetical protein
MRGYIPFLLNTERIFDCLKMFILWTTGTRYANLFLIMAACRLLLVLQICTKHQVCGETTPGGKTPPCPATLSACSEARQPNNFASS